MSGSVIPFSLKDAPALIEHLLPVQKLSAEAYKEQMAGSGKTLTALGSYWKGRKPLILAKACILGALLPATADLARDLEIFEMLMGMNMAALEERLEEKNSKEGRFILAQHRSVGHNAPYRTWVEQAARPEECGEDLFAAIWDAVNAHLGTDAHTFPKLVEQLGIMRFGHRPRVADTFCGSGQIPFEAARLGCDVYASDLNPVACMLTWGDFNIVGGSKESRDKLVQEQQALVQRVQAEVDALGIETDGKGWRAKVFLYCVEVRCPQTGWLVPLLPTLIVSQSRKAIAELVPDAVHKRYSVIIRSNVSDAEITIASKGTIRSDGRGQDPYLLHTVNGVEYRTKISTIRGDYRQEDGSNSNRLRLWDVNDFMPRPDDIFLERLYAIQWMRPKPNSKGFEYEFRTVTDDDLHLESIVQDYVKRNLNEWQRCGWVPNMRIEAGYNTDQPIRERGWMYWHHLFNPRQLLLAGTLNRYSTEKLKFGVTRVLNQSSRLSRWDCALGSDKVQGVFDNQALNTLYNFGARGTSYAGDLILADFKHFPLQHGTTSLKCQPADQFADQCDIFITDPPYGDAVKYEEILEFFIAWLRTNPPAEFADWVWDSRRSLSLNGEGEDFRRGMVASYKRMAECMTDNGIQVIMFTHQSGTIWADMANIVWAAGLQVTAAWYVVTETESALRDGSHVKGTVLLVLRKRQGRYKTTRDELAWEIQEEVERQVQRLTGLNQEAKGLYRDENVFADADIQMAGYAAALRTLTHYAIIDGRDMTAEAIRPRVKGEITFVDSLIDFAVATANQCLVPQDIGKAYWDRLTAAERFYLKLLDLEATGQKTLDNYQNFAKALKVRDFRPLMASQKANAARLKSAVEFGKSEMSESSELHGSPLRAVLYALWELSKNLDGNEVLAHLMFNIPTYYADLTQRELVIELAAYLAKKLEGLRPDEASAARVLRDLVRNQRLG